MLAGGDCGRGISQSPVAAISNLTSPELSPKSKPSSPMGKMLQVLPVISKRYVAAEDGIDEQDFTHSVH